MRKTLQTDNILWIDYVKFIGIFLVIITHSGINKYIFDFIQLFFMPMFFIVSGYLYKQKFFSQNMSKIYWSLLIPYLIYQFTYLPFVVLNKIVFHDMSFGEVLPKCLLGICLGDTTNMYSFFIPVCGPCWFIFTMIILRFFVNFIKLSIKNIIFVSIICILILKILIINKINLLFCLDNTIMAIPYFLLGYLIKNYCPVDIFTYLSKNKKLIIFSIIISLLLLLYLIYYNSYAQFDIITTSLFGIHSLSLLFISGFVGTYMVICLSLLFKTTNDFINTISKNTLFIIFFHWLINFFIHWSGYYNLNILHTNIIINICMVLGISIINLVINYCAIKFIGKHAPVILGKGLTNVYR